MNPLIAKMMGLQLKEDDSVPVPAISRTRDAGRKRGGRPEDDEEEAGRQRQRSMASAIMGMGEAIVPPRAEPEEEKGIIPDEAKEITSEIGASGIKMSGDAVEKDREPDEPQTPDYGNSANKEELMAPAVALVAPDVTPQALDPLDPSQVPHPAPAPIPAAPVDSGTMATDAMNVLLGKTGPSAAPPTAAASTMEQPGVSMEAAQASVNASLGVGGSNPGLQQGVPMPDHKPGTAKPIMEAFFRYMKR